MEAPQGVVLTDGGRIIENKLLYSKEALKGDNITKGRKMN
jgi:hypothetical protein